MHSSKYSLHWTFTQSLRTSTLSTLVLSLFCFSFFLDFILKSAGAYVFSHPCQKVELETKCSEGGKKWTEDLCKQKLHIEGKGDDKPKLIIYITQRQIRVKTWFDWWNCIWLGWWTFLSFSVYFCQHKRIKYHKNKISHRPINCGIMLYQVAPLKTR